MKKKGIKWIFIGSVDNALLNMVDPMLIGLTIEDGNEIGSKSVVKNNPHEKVGVFCKKNGAPAIIEYSELPESMAEETDEDGELLYGESNIMCHLYSLEALEKIATKELPYHSAHKKAPYMNEKGEMIKVTEPNAYKYETFIFDAFNLFDNMSLLRGRREEDFAPIKNAEGNDSPETAIKLYNDFWKKQNNG
jgi:UDP-N-acetylglucosamine pyrophosphorylase